MTLADQFCLHPPHGTAINSGPGREVINAVVYPAPRRELRDEVCGDGERCQSDRWCWQVARQSAQVACQEAAIEPAIECRAEPWPHARIANAEVGRQLLGGDGRAANPLPHFLQPAFDRGQVKSRTAHADGVDPESAIPWQ